MRGIGWTNSLRLTSMAQRPGRIKTLIVLIAAASAPLAGQVRRPPARRPPPAPATTKAAAEVTCPAPLGIGVRTKLSFCEVLAGRNPAEGVLIKIPPHRGPATLTFDLHNLHLFSEEQVRAKRAYTRYTAVIGALTMDNTLISRAVVQSEFRTVADFVDRVSGGAGPGGVKAVAPTGTESIVLTIAEADEQVSLLGEKVTVEGMTGQPATFSQPGRPIAVISNVMVEYRPAPPRRTRQ